MKPNDFDEDWLANELQEPTLEDDGFTSLVLNKVNQYEHSSIWKWIYSLTAFCVASVLIMFFYFDKLTNLHLSIVLENSRADYFFTQLNRTELVPLLIAIASFVLIWLIEEYELI